MRAAIPIAAAIASVLIWANIRGSDNLNSPTRTNVAIVNDFQRGALLARRCMAEDFNCRPEAKMKGMEFLAGYDFGVEGFYASAGRMLDAVYVHRTLVLRDAAILGLSWEDICNSVAASGHCAQ